MKKQTLIKRNLVNIPLEHVLSFKSEKAFLEAMETEGHFDNEFPEVRKEIVEGIWKEAQELSTADDSSEKATSMQKGKISGNSKAPAPNTTSETSASGGGPTTAAAAPSGTTTTAPVK